MKATAIAVVLLVLGIAVAFVAVAPRTSASAVEPAIPAEPTTRTASAPALPVDVPAVPADAETLELLTYLVETRWERPGRAPETTRQRVTRTKDRVHLALEGGQQEWLFARNAAYRDRVSGWLVKHTSRRIVAYDESELRTALHVRGWADVLMMRVDPRVLDTLKSTGERREHARAEFVRYVSTNPSGSGVLDVWWSPALLLPDRLTVREGETVIRSTITTLDRRIDEASLALPRTRFPVYDAIDFADEADHHH